MIAAIPELASWMGLFLPVLLYPFICPPKCFRCDKELDFSVGAGVVSCKECTPLLTDEEKARRDKLNAHIEKVLSLSSEEFRIFFGLDCW